jgi:hypothetical protein
MTDRLTPREREIHRRLTSEAHSRGLTTGELAAVVIARLEDTASAGMARVPPSQDAFPGYVGRFGE